MALNAGRLRHIPWFVALHLLLFIPPASAKDVSGSIRFASCTPYTYKCIDDARGGSSATRRELR